MPTPIKLFVSKGNAKKILPRPWNESLSLKNFSHFQQRTIVTLSFDRKRIERRHVFKLLRCISSRTAVNILLNFTHNNIAVYKMLMCCKHYNLTYIDVCYYYIWYASCSISGMANNASTCKMHVTKRQLC